MDDEVEPEPVPPPGRRWLAWALIAAGAAAGLWLAAFPLDRLLPEPHGRRTLAPEPPGAGALPPGPAGEAALPDEPAPEAAPARGPAAVEPPATAPDAEWVGEDPGEPEEEPPGDDALRARLERQLAMNDLGGVRVEIAGDRVIATGALRHPADRQRVALLVGSLAPGLAYEDRTEVAGER